MVKITTIRPKHGVSTIVQMAIRLAPIGVFALIATTFTGACFASLIGYSHLLAILIGSMLFMP